MSDLKDEDTVFEYKTYDEFRAERMKLNYENTLRLWYSLPTNLSSLDPKLAPRHTAKQQKAHLLRLKLFAFYCSLLSKSCVKGKIHAKGKQAIDNDLTFHH